MSVNCVRRKIITRIDESWCFIREICSTMDLPSIELDRREKENKICIYLHYIQNFD
jgi:hypothetical protein